MIVFCVILWINLDFLFLFWVDVVIKFYDFVCFGFEMIFRVLCVLYIIEENGFDYSV